MLADPYLGLSQEAAAVIAQMSGGQLEFTEPDEVRELGDGEVLELLGVPLTVNHAPGHTPGSVVSGIPAAATFLPCSSAAICFFAGSIGRTDLPGGDPELMMRSLDVVLAPLADETVVLPRPWAANQHGEERASNPFLKGDSLAGRGDRMTGFRAPRGVAEYIPPDSDAFLAVREGLAAPARVAGYGYLELPIFEDTDSSSEEWARAPTW